MTDTTTDTAEPAGDPAEPINDEPAGTGFRVHLENFSGPFDLLLQLIGKHKLDVTEVALSQVTDEFIAHIRAMGSDWDLDEATEFLVIAATLLDLKAARLLPAAEVEDEDDLALLEARDLLFARLLQYKAYKEVTHYLTEQLALAARRHPRAVSLEPQFAEAMPEVLLGIGVQRLAELAVRAFTPREEPTVLVDHLHAPRVSVREHTLLLRHRLAASGGASFRTLSADCTSTLEVVARFLALLELYRAAEVSFDQVQALGDLHVRWTGGDPDAEPEPEPGDEYDEGATPIPAEQPEQPS